ncbi:unnamed protein product [Schistosoma curassoni]|uniref:Late expression factor 10 n=1 Tax=Schistosoma curassoni TaxID=6186 RepID=A0A183JT34_9TREM|nr:unnamed protein product [Schistosoma curassoni]
MSTSLAIVCPVKNFTHVIHVYFVILNASNVVRLDTQAICNTIIHFVADNAELCNSDHIQFNVLNESYSNHVHDIILPDMRSYDSCISNEIIYKYVEDVSKEPNPDQISDFILINVVCLGDLFLVKS